MNRRTLRPLGAVAAVGFGLAIWGAGCDRKRTDPVDALKALVPQIEAALNRRDIAALQRLGTPHFASNRLIIDVFGANPADTVDLRVKHLVQMPGEAQLVLSTVSGTEQVKGAGRLLTLQMVGNGEWHIDGYTVSPDLPPDDADSSAWEGQ
jgi:hypothetical protein